MTTPDDNLEDQPLLLKGESEAPPEEPPVGKLTLDSQGQEVQPSKVLEYRRLRPGQQDVPVIFGDGQEKPLRNYYLPLLLIVVSTGVLMLPTFTMPLGSSKPLIRELNIRAMWDVGMTLLAGMVLSWIIHSGLGDFHTAVLKLIAIALARFAVVAIMYMPLHNWAGFFLGFVISTPLFIFLLSYFFDFDLHELITSALLISIMRWISYFGLTTMLG